LDHALPAVRLCATKGVGTLGGGALPATSALVRRLADSDKDLRRAAIAALGAVGPKAEALALPTMCKMMNEDSDDDVRLTAVQVAPKVAAKHGELTVLALARAGTDTNKDVRLQAVTTLGSLGDKAKSGAAALGKALGDKDEAVVKAAHEAIGKLGPDAELAVPEIVNILKRTEGRAQIDLLKILGKIGPNA